MIRTQKEWHDYCVQHGTRGDMVFDILSDWAQDTQAAVASGLELLNALKLLLNAYTNPTPLTDGSKGQQRKYCEDLAREVIARVERES